MGFLGKTVHLPKMTWAGQGKLLDLATFVKNRGAGLLVHGASFRKKQCFKELQKRVEPLGFFYPYPGGEPSLEHIRHLILYAKKKKALWMAAIGGGSVLDVTKAAAGLYRAQQDPEAYQLGALPERAGLSYFAIPTTAGSGSEATINAVIINEKTKEKRSIRHHSFMADLVILDANLISGCSAEQIAWSGLDALTQSIESYTSRGSTPFTRGMAFQSFTRILESLPVVYRNALTKNTLDAHESEKLLEASYMSGIAFTNSGLGVVHGIAHPLGSCFGVAHGLVCALCLPLAIEMNREAMEPAYTLFSQAIGGDLLERIKGLLIAMKIPNVFHGASRNHDEKIIRYTLESGSTAMNPKPIERKDVEWMLEKLFGTPVEKVVGDTH